MFPRLPVDRRLVPVVLMLLATPATAQSTLQRVGATGVVRCAAVERPGLARNAGNGHWSGVFVDICRAIATAVRGTTATTEFRGYATDADFDRVRRDADDVFFLTGAEINAHALAGVVLPGPTAFVGAHAVMVPGGATEQRLADLAGAGICFRIGEPAERSLEAWFDRSGTRWLRHAFSEDGEMMDAYAVQRCHAVAGEATWLAEQRNAGGAAISTSRILAEPLNVFPIVAATGTRDARWAAVVAWTMNTLVNADRPDTTWYAGGTRAMPLPAPELGLATDWQARVIGVVGTYGAIVARHLGPASPLRLELPAAGTSAAATAQLLPYVE